VPLYDFRCEECEATFEELTAPDGAPPCPRCGGARTRRLWSRVAPPARIGLRGRAARESDARRAEREAKRRAGER